MLANRSGLILALCLFAVVPTSSNCSNPFPVKHDNITKNDVRSLVFNILFTVFNYHNQTPGAKVEIRQLGENLMNNNFYYAPNWWYQTYDSWVVTTTTLDEIVNYVSSQAITYAGYIDQKTFVVNGYIYTVDKMAGDCIRSTVNELLKSAYTNNTCTYGILYNFLGSNLQTQVRSTINNIITIRCQYCGGSNGSIYIYPCGHCAHAVCYSNRSSDRCQTCNASIYNVKTVDDYPKTTAAAYVAATVVKRADGSLATNHPDVVKNADGSVPATGQWVKQIDGSLVFVPADKAA